MTPLLALLALRQPLKIDVGEVDLFGQTGLDEAAIRKLIPFKPGDTLSLEEFAKRRNTFAADMQKLLGKPGTDVYPVFYDVHHKAMLYIGLPGPMVHSLHYLQPPKGRQVLPGDGLSIYQSLMNRMAHITPQTNLSEDDSKGYALFNDPVMRSIQLDMRSYALSHEPAIRSTLLHSASAEQRQAAAMLLGYAKRSMDQLGAIAHAAVDQDSGVRNNATRALVVAVRADPSAAGDFEPTPFIEMLQSLSWTDRNKGGNLVAALTESRDPNLLRDIKIHAYASLVEMAKWTNPPHAATARIILGRIAGIPEKRLQELARASDPAPLFEALKHP